MPCETPWGELAWAHDIPVSEQDQLPRPPQTPGGTQLSVLPQPADDDDFDWEEVKHCRSVSRLGTTDGSLEPSSFAPSSYATPSTFGMQSGINENPHKGAGSPLPSMPDGPATPSMRHLESASSSSCCSTPAVVREKTPPIRTKPLDNRRKSIPLKPNFIKPPASPSLSLSGAACPPFTRCPSNLSTPSLSPRPTTGDIPLPPSRSGRALAHGQATRKVRGRRMTNANQERGQNCNIMVLAS